MDIVCLGEARETHGEVESGALGRQLQALQVVLATCTVVPGVDMSRWPGTSQLEG